MAELNDMAELKSKRIEQMHRGEWTSRRYTKRTATRMSHHCSGGCAKPIKIGDVYWDHHGDIRYHDRCFRRIKTK